MRLLFIDVEFDGGGGIGGEGGDLHFAELPLAGRFGFGKISRDEFLDFVSFGIKRLGEEDAVAFVVDPGFDFRVAAGSGIGIGAFENAAGAAAFHFFLQQFLVGPMDEFEAEVGDGKIGAGEGSPNIAHWSRGRRGFW